MAIICPDWTTRSIVIRRVFWVVGTLSVYRAITLTVTTMPTPKEGCVPSTTTDFGEMFLIALQMIPGTVQACTDDIFSGHTVFMVTCAIQWRLYCKNKWVTYFSYIYITVGLYFVVATRLHYTVDVVLAIFITYAVWSLYIAMIDVVMEKEYFGLRRHNDKYTCFDGKWSEIENQDQPITSNASESEKEPSSTIVAESSSNFASKRATLQHHMNRMRGPGIGYDRGEHDRVAFVPMQYNTWLTGAVRWCDGLDLRMHHNTDSPSSKNWDELVISRQANVNNDSSSAVQKAEIQDIDLEAGQSHSSNHGRDATVAPVMLESVHVVNSGVGSN
ncbi:hypothetical protein BGZ76_008493 [Entomortierella beljakovae]|nr:hypothetical protein BGZ76_008493 [Entomortierella beljakovae]